MVEKEESKSTHIFSSPCPLVWLLLESAWATARSAVSPNHESPTSYQLAISWLQQVAWTHLGLQSRFGDYPVKFQVVCPQNGTAVPIRVTRYKSYGGPQQIGPNIFSHIIREIYRFLSVPQVLCSMVPRNININSCVRQSAQIGVFVYFPGAFVSRVCVVCRCYRVKTTAEKKKKIVFNVFQDTRVVGFNLHSSHPTNDVISVNNCEVHPANSFVSQLVCFFHFPFHLLILSSPHVRTGTYQSLLPFVTTAVIQTRVTQIAGHSRHFSPSRDALQRDCPPFFVQREECIAPWSSLVDSRRTVPLHARATMYNS